MQPRDTRPNLMTIDLAALDANLALVRRLAGRGIAVVASVKANAYGHGIVEIARRLAERKVEVLATGFFADAVAMREAGVRTPILMMGGALPAAMSEVLRLDLIPTVHNGELLEAVATAAPRRVPIYIKVDGGLGRLGVPLREAQAFVLAAARSPRIEVAGLYTHLPFADEAGRAWAADRMAKFDALVADLAKAGLAIPVTQARASSALLAGITDHCTAVSPGGMLYGLAPVAAGMADVSALRPAMSAITTRLIHVSAAAADRTPGYESRHAARVTGATGVVPFGRLDGNRAPLAGSGAHMLIHGVKAPTLGVSLEHTVLDLSAVPRAAVGQEVVVLGASGNERIAVEDLARWQGAGVNDVLMSLNGRVARRVMAA
jgi:alanine racemase